MIRLLWTASAEVRYFLRRYMPSNIVLDGPGWLHLVVVLCIWNALKMMAIGPVSVVLVVKALARERRTRNRAESGAHDRNPQPELIRSVT